MGFRRSMQIFVKPITGKTITVKVDSSDTILDLKKMLHSRLSIPTFHQRLIFCGRQLQDTHTISKCRIRKESNLHMVAVLRGGMQAADDEELSAIEKLKAVLAEKEKALAEKEKALAKQEEEKKAALAEKEEEKTAALAEKEKALAEKEKALAEKEEEKKAALVEKEEEKTAALAEKEKALAK